MFSEDSIFSKLILDISKAINPVHPENIESIFVTKYESKWLKSIDIIFCAFISIFASKKLSIFVTNPAKHNLTLVFLFTFNSVNLLYFLFS